ncbi:hypothetical protein LSTR_LSTR007139 [Laodelphax striatellus]|uniref:SAM domain-containing protein n=1 Tax=Laodelphax striatellus TaxID=195883 RepID=A0A482WVZ9_LAOST|nr:hypothetical protein LSTR_LSTR007139 [Laodelphax striatellus]
MVMMKVSTSSQKIARIMDNGNTNPPSSTTSLSTGTGAVQNVAVTTNAANPTATTTMAGNLNPSSDTNTPRLIQLKVPMAATPPSPTSSATPPRPPTPHASVTPSTVPTTPTTTIAQAPPTSNIPRICNLGPLIYLQATGVKGGTPVNSAVAQGGNTASSTPVQFTMPQVISETSTTRRIMAGGGKSPNFNLIHSKRIIAGNPQIIHANNSQTNQAFAYLGTLIKQGVKGKEATSQKVLLTPMPNKSPQIAILPGSETQTHGNKTPMTSLILQSGTNVQGKHVTGLILGSPNSNPTGNKTSLLLPAPPGGAQAKKITNINIPVTGKANVPNIIRQNTSAGKTFILPQSGVNSPGLIIPASNQVNKPGGNQVTGLILPSTSSSGLIMPASSSTTAPLTNLILTTQPTSSSSNSSNQQVTSLILSSNPSSSSVVTSGLTQVTAPSVATTSVATSVGGGSNAAAAAKMAGIFLPVSMEVQGKNNMTHHLTISNGKIHSGESTTASITVPALKPVGGYGLPALQPISKDGSSISSASYLTKSVQGRSVLKKNVELTLSVEGKIKKDEMKQDDLLCHEKSDLIDISDNVTASTEDVDMRPELVERKASLDGDAVKVDYDLDKENTLPNLKDEDKDDVKVELRTSPSPEEFDPMKVLEWDAKGVGKLPGSDLKFRLNEFGMMILHDENDTKTETDVVTPSPPAAASEKKEEKKPHKEPVKASSKNTDEIYCCDSCGCYGLSTEFLDAQFCSVACRKFMQMKSPPAPGAVAAGGVSGGGGGSSGSKRQKQTPQSTEDKLRDLKLRRKRRKMKIMEVRRAAAMLAAGGGGVVEAASGGEAAAAAAAVAAERKKEIDWLKEFVELKAKREAAAQGAKGATGSSKEGEMPPKGGEPPRRTSLDDVTSDQDLVSAASRSGSVSPELSEVGDDLSQTDKKVPWLSKSGEFLWNVYLNYHKAKAAHTKLFKDPFPYQKNGFKVGMKLEGIDPEHQSYICVLTVAEVKGFRIRLHFDGYPENHDFWTNADSPDIFQPGWCEKNSHQLQQPRGYTSHNFNWTFYLKQCKAQAAPKSLFASRHANPVTPNQFRVGMKVEAVDRHNSQLICVATVADIIDNRLLIHFDSWGDMYDYWVDPSSPYIHPVGWCADNGHELTPPNNYKSAATFSWDAYLKETKSAAAPARAFKTRPPTGFRSGMRLEAVDRRAPHLVRVATVAAVRDHQIRLAFDGMPDAFGYWVDDDCSDIHPVGWAHKTQHPLEQPPNPDSDPVTTCTTPGCRGDGHTKGTMLTRHESAAHCPYSPHYLNNDSILPDRFHVAKQDIYEQLPLPLATATADNKSKSSRESRESSVTTDGNKGSYDGDSGDEINGRRSVTSNEDDSRLSRTRQSNFFGIERSKRGRKRKTEKQEQDASGELKKLRKDLIESVLKPGYQVAPSEQSPLWSRHSAALGLVKVTDLRDDPATWTAKQVANFLSQAIPPNTSKVFVEQEIDGEALLMLTQSDLTSLLGFKLGPAIKIYNMITILRQKIFAI